MRRSGIVVAVLSIAVGLSAPAVAADAPFTAGFVDVQEVFSKYEKTAKSNSELEAFGNQLDAQLKALAQHKLLDDAEVKELQQLVVKADPTDKDRERLAALDEKQKGLDKELIDLQAKKEPTAQESARLKELQDKSTAADAALTKLSEEFEKQFGEKKNKLSEEIRNDILKAIEAVAKDKKLSLVLDKIAVLYGGTDITEPVISRLNKK
jgi:outer membrane protein